LRLPYAVLQSDKVIGQWTSSDFPLIYPKNSRHSSTLEKSPKTSEMSDAGMV